MRVQLALAQESFKRHTLFVTRPRFSSFPQPNRERLSHEVEKRRRLSGGSPRPSTRSRQKTQAMRHDIYRLRVSFSGGARPDGEAGRAEHTAGRTGGPVCRRWPVGRPSRWRTGGRPRTWAPAPSLRCLLAHRARTKNAVGRRECTGPQRLVKNTSLNPNSAQLSSSSRPNHT